MRLSRSNLLGRFGLQLVMTAFSVLQQIILVRYVAIYWTDELYGSWLVLVALSNLLIVTDMGLHSYTYLSLQRALHRGDQPDDAEAGRISLESMVAYGLVALLVIFAGAFASYGLPLAQWLNLSGATAQDLQLALFLSFISGSGFAFGFCFSAMLRVIDALNETTYFRLAHISVTLVVVLTLLHLNYGLVAVVAATTVTQWLLVLALAVYASRHVKGFGQGFADFSPHSLRSTFKSAFKYIVPLSSDLVLMNIPTLIMGVLGRPPIDIVLFSLTRVMTSFVRQIATFATYPAANEVGQFWTRKDGEGARRAIVLSLAIAGAGTGVLCGYLAIYSAEIVHIWTNGVYALDPVMLLLQLMNVAFAFPAIAGTTALMFTDQPQLVTRSKIAQAVLLMIACFAFGSLWGARGISAAVLIAELLAATAPLTIGLKSAFSIRDAQFWQASLAPFASTFLLSLVAAFGAKTLWPASTVMNIALSTALWLPLPAALCLWIFFFFTRTRP